MRFMGAHMSTAGGLHNSLTSGKGIGCTAVQLFTGNPRQWVHLDISDETVEKYKLALASTGMEFTVAHDSYLINLAAPDSVILDKSRVAFRKELERAEALGIPWVVTHMGARLDSDEQVALKLLSTSLDLILEETAGFNVGVALETTAGQGTGLGHRFEQIEQVIDGCSGNRRLGVCLDTCHVFVAGYDLRTADAFQSTFDDFDKSIGIDRLKVIHANDAKKPLGSRVDRHEHIGDGEIGELAFRLLVNDARLKDVPIIIETPELDTMHAVNLARLMSFVGAPV